MINWDQRNELWNCERYSQAEKMTQATPIFREVNRIKIPSRKEENYNPLAKQKNPLHLENQKDNGPMAFEPKTPKYDSVMMMQVQRQDLAETMTQDQMYIKNKGVH